jgi:hypothetical protein
MEVLMNPTIPSPTVWDRWASDGTLLQRGYVELVLDEQHCEGASGRDPGGRPYLTLTVNLCDPETNGYTASKVFATQVSAQIDQDTSRKLLSCFMHRLTVTHRVNPLSRADDLDFAMLDGFGQEVALATARWAE